MFKKVFSIALALLLALGCLPFTVFAKGERVYTVTLKPGDAWGEDVVFRSNETGIAANYRSAKNGQFYYEDDGGLGFHYDFYKYPESWIAPERAVFVGFLEGNGNDAVNYYPLTYTNTVFIAQWHVPGEPFVAVSPSDLTFDLDAFDENGDLPFTITLSGLYWGSSEYLLPGSGAILIFYLSDGKALAGKNEIDYQVCYPYSWQTEPYDIYYAEYEPSHWDLKVSYFFDYKLHVDPAALAAAIPTSYQGELHYKIEWINLERSYGPIEGSISLRLAKFFDVTVNDGSGGGRYAEGDSVTVTADAPDSGKAFKEWTGAEGLTFTSGSEKTKTATFTMPANDVTLTATYDKGYTLTVQNGSGTGVYIAGAAVTATANPAPEGKRFKEWDALPKKWIIDGSNTSPTVTFTMPGYTHTIYAIYEDIPTPSVSTGVTEPAGPAGPTQDDDLCKWDNADHGSSLCGRFVKFCHSILWFFAHLFGKR